MLILVSVNVIYAREIACHVSTGALKSRVQYCTITWQPYSQSTIHQGHRSMAIQIRRTLTTLRVSSSFCSRN